MYYNIISQAHQNTHFKLCTCIVWMKYKMSSGSLCPFHHLKKKKMLILILCTFLLINVDTLSHRILVTMVTIHV
jgi:hypothetical protein